MITYILRRILIMIPTLIGMTFLLYALVAIAPGGIGAGARFNASGGQAGNREAALQKAALEDRFGLDDHLVVQYVHWLGRVSPVKFGWQDQVGPGGTRVKLPKELKAIPAANWFDDIEATVAHPKAEPYEFASDATESHKASVFRRVSSEFAETRADYLVARVKLETAISSYFTELRDCVSVDDEGERLPRVKRRNAVRETIGTNSYLDDERNVKKGVIRRHEPVRTQPAFAEVERLARAMVEQREKTLKARETYESVVRAKPFDTSGFTLIPNTLSVGKPDLGSSLLTSEPVEDLIARALPVTLLLNGIAIPIIYFIAIPAGMLAATKQGKFVDTGLGTIMIGLYSIPIVWAGVLAIGYLANNAYLGWFPVNGLHGANADAYLFLPSFAADGSWHRGYLLDTLWHICLPVLCLVYGGFAVLSKQTRAAMLENFNADYVRTARAKGVAPRNVVWAHVFRNSLLPLITMFVSIFPVMLSGSVVIERIFSVPGMGSLLIDAINQREIEIILANALIIGVVNIFGLLLADILYAVADPRISYN